MILSLSLQLVSILEDQALDSAFLHLGHLRPLRLSESVATGPSQDSMVAYYVILGIVALLFIALLVILAIYAIHDLRSVSKEKDVEWIERLNKIAQDAQSGNVTIEYQKDWKSVRISKTDGTFQIITEDKNESENNPPKKESGGDSQEQQ